MDSPPPDPAVIRDKLRRIFDYLNVPATVEIDNAGPAGTVVITPHRAADAERLARALSVSKACRHPALEKRGDGGTYCTSCGAQIYLPPLPKAAQ